MAKNSKMIQCKHCGQEIAASAKVCSQCGGKNKKPIFKKWWFWVIIIIVVVALASGGSGDSEKKENSSSVSNTSANVTEKQETKVEEKKEEVVVNYTSVTVAQMMDDLEANALKAQSNYKDQYLEITGKLSNIDASGKYISLVSAEEDFAFIGVQCYIKGDSQKNQVMNMSEGDTVTLRGKCTDVGEVLGYSLDIDSIDGYSEEVASTSDNGGVIECVAADLVSALQENALKAQNTYKNRDIIVTGQLSNIDASGKYIDIIDPDNPYAFVNIQCYIKTDDVKNAVMDLTVGDTVTIEGKCTDVGEILGYSVNIDKIN